MNQVLNFLDKLTHPAGKKKSGAPVPAASPKFLTFNFVDEQNDLNLLDLDAEPTPASSSLSLGRTGSCLGVRNLSASACFEEGKNSSSSVVYLQRDARETESENSADVKLFRKPERPRGIPATALLDASDILQMANGREQAYSLARPETAVGKQVSLEVLRKLSKRASYEERLESVRKICEKVSAEALSPLRRAATGPLRQTIQIKIG